MSFKVAVNKCTDDKEMEDDKLKVCIAFEYDVPQKAT